MCASPISYLLITAIDVDEAPSGIMNAEATMRHFAAISVITDRSHTGLRRIAE